MINNFPEILPDHSLPLAALVLVGTVANIHFISSLTYALQADDDWYDDDWVFNQLRQNDDRFAEADVNCGCTATSLSSLPDRYMPCPSPSLSLLFSFSFPFRSLSLILD